MPEDHVLNDVEFRVDRAGRGYRVRCSCGWQSEVSDTPNLAVAAGEQHVTLAWRGLAPGLEPP